MKREHKHRPVLKFILSAIVALGGLFLLQRLLVPKYVDGIVEGAFVAEYYKEEKDFDVIFIGDCEVYENFSPIVLWEQYGINSYIRGSAEQYIWQSYYLLEDTLRYETPEVVIFNIQSLQFDVSQNEAYNRMTLEGMEWSPAKVKAILASMKPGEKFLDYVFPILRYHSRWSELESTDLRYLFDTKKVSHNGYYMRVDVRPAENVPEGRILADYSFGENAWKYLDMMTELCEEKGIELILIKAPSLYPYWYEEWEVQVEDYAAEHNLKYINFLELTEEVGIDYSLDTYDAGLHMNLSGAEKLASWLGNFLKEEIGLLDRRGEEALAASWKEKIADYEAEKQAQYEKYGMTGEK
ncbi:MAG: SGNH/GDSL hydrolase family protein [Lachnospiraceae bacterium]|nr:SGNH/GDSL hydrolase family protein [Lachnospiraceae bacterium]